jgi:geranylgeranylglycerol-phosphate geranylgeranyltransferase
MKIVNYILLFLNIFNVSNGFQKLKNMNNNNQHNIYNNIHNNIHNINNNNNNNNKHKQYTSIVFDENIPKLLNIVNLLNKFNIFQRKNRLITNTTISIVNDPTPTLIPRLTTTPTTTPTPTPKINKIKSFMKLIRINNVLPTLLLSFSGGWIMNPSFINLLNCKIFIVSTINTLLIMSSSMIINDLFDIEIDKINNPERPLITKEITIKEAILSFVSLISLTEYLSITFLPGNLQFIINLMIINVILYTPFYKKVIFLKNIICSSIVSFTIFFSGLSSSNYYMSTSKKFNILSIVMSSIFFGSLYNELLLDMSDLDGDLKNNVKTIPVVIGNERTWILANFILYFNMLSSSLSVLYLFNYNYGLLLSFIYIPLLYDLHSIKKNNFSKNSIINVVSNTTKPLFFILLYLSTLVNLYK